MMKLIFQLLLTFILVIVANAGRLRAADRRCLDPPASNATLLNNCQPIGGYSWDGADCTYQDNAGCSKTRNKFKEKDKCLKSEWLFNEQNFFYYFFFFDKKIVVKPHHHHHWLIVAKEMSHHQNLQNATQLL